MKILLTAFEPFGSHLTNSSEQVLVALPDRIAGAAVHKIVLPVSFSHSIEPIAEYIDSNAIDWIVAMGQAARRIEISLERTAVNIADAKLPDNDGFRPCSEKVIENAPSSCNTTLPIDAICESMKSTGIACHVSHNAGRYVCNALYFHLLYIFSHVQSIFVHLPSLAEKDDKPRLSAQEMTHAIGTLIKTIVSKANTN